MKELSIEEKAKRYDEALKVLHKYDGANIMFTQDLKEEMFPELAESEDERMWKLIKKYAHCNISDMALNADHITREQLESWLEKQLEQKSVVIIPKFRVGDEIKTANEESLTITKIDGKGYWSGDLFICDFDEECLWDLGEKNQKHFELKAGHWYICHRAYCCRADHLTVKEGERFMCEKDGVVKGFIVKEPEKYFKEVCAPAPMEGEQKPAWSEEDEKNLVEVISIVQNISSYNKPYDGYIDWLKSLRNRVQPQKQWKPSDEQMHYLSWIANVKLGDSIVEQEVSKHLNELLEDLKKLREE